VVDGGKALDHVAVESASVAAHPLVTLVQRLVGALAHPAGTAGVTESYPQIGSMTRTRTRHTTSLPALRMGPGAISHQKLG
jgi:hypothetical protein